MSNFRRPFRSCSRRCGARAAFAILAVTGLPGDLSGQAYLDPRDLWYSGRQQVPSADSVPLLQRFTVWALLNGWDEPGEGPPGDVPLLAAAGLLKPYGIDTRTPAAEARRRFIRATATVFRERLLVLDASDTTRTRTFGFVRGTRREVEWSVREYAQDGAKAGPPVRLLIRCDQQDREMALADMSARTAEDEPFIPVTPGSPMQLIAWTGCRIGQWWDRWMVPMRSATTR